MKEFEEHRKLQQRQIAAFMGQHQAAMAAAAAAASAAATSTASSSPSGTSLSSSTQLAEATSTSSPSASSTSVSSNSIQNNNNNNSSHHSLTASEVAAAAAASTASTGGSNGLVHPDLLEVGRRQARKRTSERASYELDVVNFLVKVLFLDLLQFGEAHAISFQTPQKLHKSRFVTDRT